MDMEFALAGVTNAVAIAERLREMKLLATNAKAQSLLANLQHQLGEVQNCVAGLMEPETSPARKSRKSKTERSELVYQDGLYHILLDTP